MQYPYLNGAIGQKDTDVELYILLLHYRRTPDPESIFNNIFHHRSTLNFSLREALRKKRGLKKKERPQEKRERPRRMGMIQCTV
jgi:hypothetical protein